MLGRRLLHRPDRWLARHSRALEALALGLAGFVVVCVILSKVTNTFPAPGELDPGLRRFQLLGSARLDLLDALIFPARPQVAALTVVVLSAIAWRQGGWRTAVLAPAAASVVLVVTAAKDFPPASTLPSGHAAYAVAVFGLAAWICLRVRQPAIAAGLVALALAVGVAKVALDTHFPIDVLVGDALGLAWLLGVLLVARRLRHRPGAP